MYRFGEGVEQNYEEAVKWYRRAAEQGDAEAEHSLALLCHGSDDAKLNYEEAIE